MVEKKKDDREDSQSLFRKLTRLFKSTPTIRRKIRAADTTVAASDRTRSNGFALFQRTSTPTYSTLPSSGYDMAQRLMRYQEYHDMEQCLAGDTLIAVPGGYVPIKELAERYGTDEEFVVYAYDHNLKKIVPAMAKQPRQTCVDHAYKVKFDNGRELIGTINHRLLRRDGCFCEIGDLKPGDAMMPFRWEFDGWLSPELSSIRDCSTCFERNDITFGRILEVAQRVNFDHERLLRAFDVSSSVIDGKLRSFGYDDWKTFVSAYEFVHVDEQRCDFVAGELALRVVSVEYHGVIPLYDLTVDGYKNFATDFIISHNTPEISAALDLWADETVSQDDDGRILHVFSENERIRDELEELFYNVVNTEFNLRPWVRNLAKHGDAFIFLDVAPGIGIQNAVPVPVNEMEREENYDPNDPWAVRFKFSSRNTYLENWEIAHFRLLGNDLMLPYGTSVIEAARRIWRQLILAEDAMLVYRVTRAPDRWVFYLDVGNMAPEDITHYVEEQKKVLAMNQIIDPGTGRVDLRFNPMNMLENFYIPRRNKENGTEIQSLAGGQNVAAIEDVAYLQKKLFAALKVPRAYLSFDEGGGCFVGSTKVSLLDGTSMMISDLAALDWAADQDVWVHSYDSSDGSIVPGRVKRAWLTKNVERLYRVQLDSGNTIECTENHPFLCRDGMYRRVDELVVGQSLMPLYRRLSSSKKNGGDDFIDGYEMSLNNDNNEWEYTHKIVYHQKCSGQYSVKKQRVIHHVNINKRDNRPTNLMEMDWNSHRAFHRANLETTLFRPDVIEKRKIEQLKWVKSDEHREFKRNFMRQHLRENPDHPFLQNCSSECATERMLKLWSRSDYRALKSQQSKEYWNNPTYRNRYMGDNNHARKKNSMYDIEWLRQFCAEHDVTSINQWRGDYRDSVKEICPFGSRHVKHLLTKHGFSNWKEFKSTVSYRDDVLYTQKFVNRNHKIVAINVIELDEPVAVYDIEVEKWHNFAVAGDGCQNEFDGFIFVHNSKATAAQGDIRLSRSVAVVQKTVIAELNKMASVHLFARGFRGNDLINFTLRLSNPSTIAQQQKLELWRTRLEIAASSPDTVLSRAFIRREIFGLSEQQSKEIDNERYAERTVDATLDSVAISDEEGGGAAAPSGGGGGSGPSPGGEGEEEEGPELTPPLEPAGGGEEPEPEQQNAGDEPEEEEEPGLELLTSADDPEAPPTKLKLDRSKLPVNVAKHIERTRYNRSRVRHHGSSKTGMPDMARMTGNETPEMQDPYDSRALRAFATNPFGEAAHWPKASLGPDLERALLRMNDRKRVLIESATNDSSDEIFTIVEDSNDPKGDE